MFILIFSLAMAPLIAAEVLLDLNAEPEMIRQDATEFDFSTDVLLDLNTESEMIRQNATEFDLGSQDHLA